MSSIVTAVVKTTVGLLLEKGRDKAAKKLKDGDVTDQKVRELIVREIEDVRSKLQGLSRKDLLASFSFFKEGIELLYEVFHKARPKSEKGALTTQAPCAEGLFLVKGVRKLDLTDLDESALRELSDAKKRFKDARREATRAFNNEALETSDRILAMQYRVMATILEKVDNPAEAMAPCRVCIAELHSLPAVQECFNVEMTKGLRARFGKDERRKNICNVCHVNFVIYDVTVMICFANSKELSNWPSIGSGEEKIDPLRDERVITVLRTHGMEHCCVPWSFCEEVEEKYKLKDPEGIDTNSSGQFIVGDYLDRNVKVFDSEGTFTRLFSLPNDDVDTRLCIVDVATDINDSIYVLVMLKENGHEGFEHTVYEFDDTSDLHHKFPVKGAWASSLAVTDSGKVLVLSDVLVDVYETEGQFVFSFGEDILKDAWDVTVANGGRVLVVDRRDSCVHLFSEHGDHFNKFQLQRCFSCPRIALHRPSEHVVVVSLEEKEDILHVEIYNKDDEFVRSTQIHQERIDFLRGMTVNTEGRIALACKYLDRESFKFLPSKVLLM